jgi:hypothetical protein
LFSYIDPGSDVGRAHRPRAERVDEMKAYVIKQGDYLTALAFRRGFDALTIWNDPANSDLRQQRASMDMLAPGDIIQLPDERPVRSHHISAGGNHRFVLGAVPKVTITLMLQDDNGPIVGTPYSIHGVHPPIAGTSRQGGMVRFDVPVTISSVTIELPDRGTCLEVRIGHLDPIAEPSGVRQRLNHLGFGPTPDGEPSSDAVSTSIGNFQQSCGLAATGQMDEETLTRLRSAHES